MREKFQRDVENVEKVIAINRCAKVVKGGRRFSFSALVAVGDGKNRVGLELGKANEVAEAIRKGTEKARRSMVSIEHNGQTIAHPVIGVCGGAKILLKPATPGTGVIAGAGVRSIIEAAGVEDVLTKSLGSDNILNVAKATLDGLTKLRTKEYIFELRGIKSGSK